MSSLSDYYYDNLEIWLINFCSANAMTINNNEIIIINESCYIIQ